MPATRSEEYYFPRDNLVIQVGDTLFKLYSGNLELHSGFFRDMLATPSEDIQEGKSDEYPLRLPPDLCSAEIFTTLCKFICPKIVGVFPSVHVQDFAKWEPVLNASDALQMAGVQNYILARFGDDEAGVETESIKLLSWAMRSELPLENLKLKCIYALVYRRRPLSEAEMSILGHKASSQVTRARERILIHFLSSTSAGSLVLSFPTHPSCERKSSCRNAMFKHFIHKLVEDDPINAGQEDNSDIFQIVYSQVGGLCSSSRCVSQSVVDEIRPSLRKGGLDDKVRRCVLGVEAAVGES